MDILLQFSSHVVDAFLHQCKACMADNSSRGLVVDVMFDLHM
jgi:hypothetical protein